jgi:hypothetical protein
VLTPRNGIERYCGTDVLKDSLDRDHYFSGVDTKKRNRTVLRY